MIFTTFVFKRIGERNDKFYNYSIHYGIYWNLKSMNKHASDIYEKHPGFKCVAVGSVPLWNIFIVCLPYTSIDEKGKVSFNKKAGY